MYKKYDEAKSNEIASEIRLIVNKYIKRQVPVDIVICAPKRYHVVLWLITSLDITENVKSLQQISNLKCLKHLQRHRSKIVSYRRVVYLW